MQKLTVGIAQFFGSAVWRKSVQDRLYRIVVTQYPLCHVGCVSCVSCSDSYGNGGANCHAGFECRTPAMLEVLLGLGDVGVCRMLDLVMNLVLTLTSYC